jgi:ribosomal protein S14
MPDVEEPQCEWCGARPAGECEHCFAVVLCRRCMREHVRNEHGE